MEKKIYHWTELRPPINEIIVGSMLRPGGVQWPIKCRLKGEATKGPNATEAIQRVAVFDSSYAVDKINSFVDRLEHNELKDLLIMIAEKNGIKLQEVKDAESSSKEEKVAKTVRKKG